MRTIVGIQFIGLGVDIPARCKAIILVNLTSGDISVKQMAQHLHLSRRTLTRRLESHGNSFKALVDEIRSELAFRYLTDLKNSITEAVFLLGFSHPSFLSRASTRWFGVSPVEYHSTHTGPSANPKLGWSFPTRLAHPACSLPLPRGKGLIPICWELAHFGKN